MTRLVKTYTEHPIRVIVSYSIPVTINTDDFLIFNQSVSEEFLTLYQEGVLSPYELELARQNGLAAFFISHNYSSETENGIRYLKDIYYLLS